MTDGTALIAAIDWMAREAGDKASRFHQKVDITRVAAMGMSCGGLMSYGASADPRVSVETVYCLGLCASGPSALVGEVVHGRLDEAASLSLIDRTAG